MRTIRCGSCDATFPEGSIGAHAARCPRCGQLFRGPRSARLPHAQPELGPADLAIPFFCSICGCILAAAERTGLDATCQYPGCVHRRAANQLAAVHERAVAAAREQRARIHRQIRVLAVGIEPRTGIAILPANTWPLVAMTRGRRDALAARLREIADELASERDGTAGAAIGNDTKGEPIAVAESPELVAQACATCRGFCCKAGGDHAFLNGSTLERVLDGSPGLSIEALQEAYLVRIPDLSYEDSCVFHGRSGCTLDRGMRADVCNDFLCGGAADLPVGSGERTLAAATEDGRIVRLAVIGGRVPTPLPVV